jgi:hypothetical protein
MKKKNYSCEKKEVKGPNERFGYFWFLNHSLRWFLVVPPKDAFALVKVCNYFIIKENAMNWAYYGFNSSILDHFGLGCT